MRLSFPFSIVLAMFPQFWGWIKNFQILTNARKEGNRVCRWGAQRISLWGCDIEASWKYCMCLGSFFSFPTFQTFKKSNNTLNFFCKNCLANSFEPLARLPTGLLPQSLSCIENLELWFCDVRLRKSQGKFPSDRSC